MRKDAHALEELPFGSSSFYLDNVFMFENRRWPLPSDRVGPFEATDFVPDIELGNNDSSAPRVTVYSPYTYTPLNKAKGAIVPLATKYSYHNKAFRNVY